MEHDGNENAWELSKENVQPLKTGRKMRDLQRALQQQDASVLHAEAQKYELELRKTGNNHQDKLDIWCSYIGWREQNYPGFNKDTVSLLQNCLVHFKDMKEFHQNEKYILLWIKMIEVLDDPMDVFNFMLDNDIGTSLAIFYKSYADHLELVGSTKKADNIYNLGIYRNAEPLDWLKQFKSEFELRMMKRSCGLPVEEEMEAIKTRKVLGMLKPMKSGRVGNDRMKLQAKNKPTSKTTSSQHLASGGFEIYGDSSTPGVLSSATGQLRSNPLDPSSNVENVKQMQKFKGTKVKGGSTSGTSNFEIFQESSDQEIGHATPKQIVVSSRKPLSSRKGEEVQDPFYAKNDNNPKVVHKYCKNLIDMGTSEISFEELKAQLPRYNPYKQDKQQKPVRSKLDFGKTQNKGQSNTCQLVETKALQPEDEAVNLAKQESIKKREEILENIFNCHNDTEHIPTESTGYVGSSYKRFQPEITGVFSSPNKDFDITGKIQELDQTQQWGKATVLDTNTERIVASTNILEELEKTNTFGMARNVVEDQSEAFLPLADTSLLPEKSKMKSLNNDSLNSVNNLMFNLGIEGSQTGKSTKVQFTYDIEQLDTSSNNALFKDSSPTIQTKNAVEKMFHETLDVDKLRFTLNDSKSTDTPFTRTGFGIFNDNDDNVKKQEPKGFSIFNDKVDNLTRQEPKDQEFEIFKDQSMTLKQFNQNTGFNVNMHNEKSMTGFQLFQDETEVVTKPSNGFSIFQDDEEQSSEHKTSEKPARFSIFEDKQNNVPKQSSDFSIYQDKENGEPPKSADLTLAAFETGASDYPKHLPMPHRPVSTPAHPASLAHQQNLGHLTFGANITAFSEHQESNLDLSTIPECSHESDRSRTDSERSTDGVDLASLSSTVFRFDPFNSNTKSKCVDRVTPEISSTKGFLRINGPIPHLNGGKDICLGPRQVQINKGIKQEVSGLSIYKARYTDTKKPLVLKVVDQSIALSKSYLWDYYITCTIHERLEMANVSEAEHRSFIRTNHLSLYSNAICYESDFYNTGTLMDLINLYKRHSQHIDEELALLYAYEIINTIHILHQLKIVHCDIHPKKFLLGDRENLDNGALSVHALTLANFKNSVDKTLLPSNSQLCGRSNKDSYETLSMKNGEFWGPEVDYYAAAASIHDLVFQNPLNSYFDTNKNTMRICNVPPRGWDEKLWLTLFTHLINGASQIDLLLEGVQHRLSEPVFLERLDAAIQKKEDLLMEDD